mmetsp:Transcript_33644/g.60890  ORF Transcript_33644/g.60890 Transcript_33644/m.60890 type:complete len:181 (-) Transcript_33644:45-587(-)
MPIEQVEGRIKGFNNNWNKTWNDIISKEDKSRWEGQDKARSTGSLRTGLVKLPRAHTTIGAFPGQTRNVVLSPRKSAAVCFLEQRLLRAESDSKIQTMRDSLYEGVTAEEQGKHKYLKLRAGVVPQKRYVDPATTSMTYGWQKPAGEYRASPFCHKPGVETGFMRPNGTQTYKDLPITGK